MNIKKQYFFIGIVLFIYQAGLCKKKDIIFDHDTVINQSIEIPENETCIIKPGVTLKFSGYYCFAVNGLLIVEGDADNPVLITCVKRVHGSMERPCWQGFDIRGKNADAFFKHCRIEGAYRNFIYGTKAVFDSCEFVGNHYGIYCSNKSIVYIKNCRIYRNKYGIITDFASPLILDNVITENVIGVYMQLNSRVAIGRNVISGNRVNIRSDESLGKNYDALSLKYIWDFMRQLY